MSKEPSKITRFEVIDWREGSNAPGRILVEWHPRLEVYYELQDEGQTLKVFLKDRK